MGLLRTSFDFSTEQNHQSTTLGVKQTEVSLPDYPSPLQILLFGLSVVKYRRAPLVGVVPTAFFLFLFGDHLPLMDE